jgi:hypothetical protein
VARRLHLPIQRQPDDTTCGPTCLHAVYNFYGDNLPLEQVVSESHQLEEGGTLAVLLACHALRRGYRAKIYTYNLQMFDPTWFRVPEVDLRAKLIAQRSHKKSRRVGYITDFYLEFLELGGELTLEELTPSLIRRYLNRGIPVLTGLSATYLYRCSREIDSGPRTLMYDDVRGYPTGHFVVVCGYDRRKREVIVADPLFPNPTSEVPEYAVQIDRLICSILMGVVTYDANILILEPPVDGGAASSKESPDGHTRGGQ